MINIFSIDSKTCLLAFFLCVYGYAGLVSILVNRGESGPS